jgi:Zn finger protein HypA/HybF involved in hydrogenase expression
MRRLLLSALLNCSHIPTRYNHGEYRTRRGHGFDLPATPLPPPPGPLKFLCKTCGEGLIFNASTWLYNCRECGSSFNRGDFNQKAGYLTDPDCPTTRHNTVAQNVRPAQLKCENCTAVLINNAKANMMSCKYCGSIYMKN